MRLNSRVLVQFTYLNISVWIPGFIQCIFALNTIVMFWPRNEARRESPGERQGHASNDLQYLHTTKEKEPSDEVQPLPDPAIEIQGN